MMLVCSYSGEDVGELHVDEGLGKRETSSSFCFVCLLPFFSVDWRCEYMRIQAYIPWCVDVLSCTDTEEERGHAVMK